MASVLYQMWTISSAIMVRAALILGCVLPVQTLAGSLDQGPEGVPFFEGRFSIHYHPIYCGVAPCPPGSFGIVADNRRIARVANVEELPGSAPAPSERATGPHGIEGPSGWSARPVGLTAEAVSQFGTEATRRSGPRHHAIARRW